LRHWLPNRLYDAYGIESAEAAEPDILKSEPLRFGGGANGARLVLDTGYLVVAARMPSNDIDYLTGTLERLRDITEPVRADFLAFEQEHAQAYLRAIVDHAERREREARAEAEQGGGVVLLEARDLQADVRLFNDNRLVRFKPALVIDDRKNSVFEHIGSHQIIAVPVNGRGYHLRGRFGNFKGSGLYDKPPLPEGAIDHEAKELDALAKASDLTEIEQITLAFMRGPLGRTDSEIAALVGVSQGYYSKLKRKVLEKLRAARTTYEDGAGEYSLDFSSSWISAMGGDDD
jgi:hypothetical protein